MTAQHPPPQPPPLPPDVAAPRGPVGESWPQLPSGWWRGTAPHATFPVPFTVADGFLLFAWTIVGQFVLGIPLAGIGFLIGADPQDAGPATLLLVNVTFIGILFTTIAYLRLRRRLSWHLLGPVRPAWRHVGWGVLAGVGGFLSIQLTLGLILTLLGEDDVPEQELLGMTDGTTSIVLLVFATVVMAPLVEEVVFRGVLFQALRRKLGLWPGAIISSLAFGFIHVEVIGVEALPAALIAVVLLCLAVWPRFPLPLRVVLGVTGAAAAVFAVSIGGPAAILLPVGLSLLGLVFALGFHRTGGLWFPIVGHAVFNAIAVGLTVLTQGMNLGV